MEDKKFSLLTLAVLKILRPLIAILLRNGMSYGHFDELVKKSYVDVAFDEFQIAGKKQTVSRVAALTGLTRKEVKRLYEIEKIDSKQKYNRATKVISGWLTDSQFCAQTNQPNALTFDEGEHSFSQLVKRYSGDIPSKAMLDLLIAAGNINIENNKIKLIKHAFIPRDDDLYKIEILGDDVGELLSTLDHNLSNVGQGLRFQRKVTNRLISDLHLQGFQQYSTHKSQLLLEDLNVWLGKHEIKDLHTSEQCQQVSVGIYYYQKNKENKQWLQNKK